MSKQDEVCERCGNQALDITQDEDGVEGYYCKKCDRWICRHCIDFKYSIYYLEDEFLCIECS